MQYKKEIAVTKAGIAGEDNIMFELKHTKKNKFLTCSIFKNCCRSTDIYWILAVAQEEIQNIFWNRAFMLMPQTAQRKCVILQAITQEYKSEGCF